MKISKRMCPTGGIDYIDVFGSYYTDGDEEGFFFKLVTKKAIIRVARAGKAMGMYQHFTLDEHTDLAERYGYINRKWRLFIRGRDAAYCNISQCKCIIKEMFEAQHYKLHWIPMQRLLNFKHPLI